MPDKVSKIIEEAASKAAAGAASVASAAGEVFDATADAAGKFARGAADVAGVAGKAAIDAAEKAAASPAAKAVAEAVTGAAGAAGNIARNAVGGAVEKAAKLAGDAAAKLAARSWFPHAANSSKEPRVVCFGEIMMRLNPPGHMRFVQARSFEASYAGGEANVAVSLANFGVDAAFVSKVPKHEIGQAAVNALRQYGVDTSRVVRGGDRLGIYFIEKGASQRASKVIYDRAGSALALARPDEYDWEAILAGATWFHFTGITPALSDGAAAACMGALEAARKLKLTVSCDLNYRKKLWSKEKAGEVMARLMPYVDVCIANEDDASDVFGIHAQGTDTKKGEIGRKAYAAVASQLMERFGFKRVAVTLRGSLSASVNEWSGLLYDGEAYFAPVYRMHVVDRVGGGDSFGAGLIYALTNGFDSQDAVEFASAASCLKHSVELDFNQVSVREVKSLAAGDASGRVQR